MEYTHAHRPITCDLTPLLAPHHHPPSSHPSPPSSLLSLLTTTPSPHPSPPPSLTLPSLSRSQPPLSLRTAAFITTTPAGLSRWEGRTRAGARVGVELWMIRDLVSYLMPCATCDVRCQLADQVQRELGPEAAGRVRCWQHGSAAVRMWLLAVLLGDTCRRVCCTNLGRTPATAVILNRNKMVSPQA